MSRTDHREIEHKFLVGPEFDRGDFARRVQRLGPQRSTLVHGEDTYYVTALQPDAVFRHRIDAERQELTIKGRGGADSEVRLEVNLRLAQDAGNQRDAVTAFLGPFQIRWQGGLHKDIDVYYFPDCEIVYYTAYALARPEHVVHCIEFEATGGGNLAAARATLAAYEARLGMDPAARTQQSLFDLLLLPQMNAALAGR
jgi:CYTH domain-containing protein